MGEADGSKTIYTRAGVDKAKGLYLSTRRFARASLYPSLDPVLVLIWFILVAPASLSSIANNFKHDFIMAASEHRSLNGASISNAAVKAHPCNSPRDVVSAGSDQMPTLQVLERCQAQVHIIKV